MKKLRVALGLSIGLLACASPGPELESEADLLHDQQHDMLIEVRDLEGAGLNPQVDYVTRSPDYWLKYVISNDGASVETRYMGPGETLGTALYMRKYELEEWFYLMCAPSNDFSVVLAKWRLDQNGKVTHISIRKDPFVEWRALGLKNYQLVSDVEWRPIVHGVGVGKWRR